MLELKLTIFILVMVVATFFFAAGILDFFTAVKFRNGYTFKKSLLETLLGLVLFAASIGIFIIFQ